LHTHPAPRTCHVADIRHRIHVAHRLQANAGIDVAHVDLAHLRLSHILTHVLTHVLAHIGLAHVGLLHACLGQALRHVLGHLSLANALSHVGLTHRRLRHAALTHTHICDGRTLRLHVGVVVVYRHRIRLILHASGLQHIRPFPTCASVTVLQVLAKMVSTEELLRLIAFSKLMCVREMLPSSVPIGGFIRELITTVAASVES